MHRSGHGNSKHTDQKIDPALTLNQVVFFKCFFFSESINSKYSLVSGEKKRWLSGVKMLAVVCLSASTKACLCRVHTDGASSFVCSVSHIAVSEQPGLALWAWVQA